MINKLKKHKKLVIAAGVVILVVVIALGAYFFISSKNKASDFSNPDSITNEPSIGAISAKDLGLVVTVRPDNLAVKFKINNSSDIEHIDYEITYDHILNGETVEEGVTGEMNIAQDGITETDYRPFGTCSSGVCRYDQGVSNVNLILKVQKKDGKVYSLQQSVPVDSSSNQKLTAPESQEDQ